MVEDMKTKISASFEIVHKETGQRYQPKSRGVVGHTYASRFAAEEAFSAMPPRWRGAYRVQMVMVANSEPEKVQHTPGPWMVRTFSQDQIGHFSNEVRVYWSGRESYWVADCGLEEPERLANARLIASCPDLLAACETLADYFAGHDPNDIPAECGSGVRAALIQARAAIAKARGGAQ